MNQEIIGGYKILEQIGAGGMAKVYLAVHKDVPNLKVILKILSDSRLVERFKQEADKLALLDGNPNICRIKHFFHHGENIVIAMEYIDGVTLDNIIKEEKKIPLERSLNIIEKVLEVVEFAHSKGIYHRDIKPNNIMIDKKGNVKVIDFGIAKAESDPSLTLAGTACGTPAYMAPEQFTPSEDTNYAMIDIYAVGTTLYYMLTGQLPFKGDNEFAIRDAKLFTNPSNPRELNAGITKELDGIIMRSLQKNPVDRFASATDMISALCCAKPKKSREKSTIDKKISKSAEKSSKLKTTFILSAIAAVILVTIITYLISSGSKLAIPILSIPVNEAVLNDNKPTLTWENIPGDDHLFNLEYANNPDFFISEIVTGLSKNRYTIDEELDSGEYYWRVQSVNEKNDSSGYSPPFKFVVNIPSLETPGGNIHIAINPSGDIYIDDELYEQNLSNSSITLDTGQHTVVIRNEQAVKKELKETFYITPDTTVELSFTFRFPEAKPSQLPVTAPEQNKEEIGEILVGSKPYNGAVIYIDDERQKRQTPNTFKLKSGQHVVKVILADPEDENILSERVDLFLIF